MSQLHYFPNMLHRHLEPSLLTISYCRYYSLVILPKFPILYESSEPSCPCNLTRSSPVSIMCTIEKRGQVFILTLTGEGEHCLSLDLIARIRCALARVRTESLSSPFSALVTRAEGQYFCNGFNLDVANSVKSSMVQWKRSRSLTYGLISITADLMSLQVPTICVVTGDASAAGFMLALSHDYVGMQADNGFICMSDLNNLVTNRYFLSMMKAKVKDEEMFKDLVLRSLKIPAIEAMDKGVIDFVEKTAMETVEAALKLGQILAKKNWNGKVHASLRKRAFPEIGRAVGLPDESNEVR